MVRKFGFQDTWISRIMTCIKSVTYSFTQLGQIFENVIPQREIRQGGPISPYLYILYFEALSSIIKRHEEVGLIHRRSIARGAPPISHILFADDFYLFFFFSSK